MSERRDSTCQKHDLPKSLQGTEDAEFVWSMIIERFPNAAPLLCEMEAVIDRAEDLLQQLRAPSCREIETSTSFCTPDSEGSTMMISARESMFTDNENAEESGSGRNVAETQISHSTVFEEDDQDVQIDSNELLTIFHSNEEQLSITEEIVSSKLDTSIEKVAKHALSLDEWSRSIGDASRSSNLVNAQLSEERIESEKGIDCSKDRAEDSSNSDQRPCIVLHHQERFPDVDNSIILMGSEINMKNKESLDAKGSGDDSTLEQRTALSILESYSERCGVPVVYEYVTDGPHRHKTNVHVIRGSFGGFTATCRGENERSTKNDLAAKLLQMIANQQIKDEKLTTLENLSKEEMMQVFNLGTDSPRETAQRKLYQLCLEAGEQLPKYSVNKMQTFKGFTFVVTCTALGYTGEGRGLRECVAKKVAADELYHQYCQDTKAKSKVDLRFS